MHNMTPSFIVAEEAFETNRAVVDDDDVDDSIHSNDNDDDEDDVDA